MTKPQLIDAVASASDRPRAEVETVVETPLGEIGKVLRSGERAAHPHADGLGHWYSGR